MKFTTPILLGLVLATAACSNYSSVTEVRPTYHSPTPAGEIIAATLKQRPPLPLVQIGQYLDAAESAGKDLKQQPKNSQARHDYNFAVSRIFGVIHDAGLEPWKAPLKCSGATKTWNFSILSDPRPQRNPSNFQITPADRFKFKGELVNQRIVKDGLGAPLVVMSKDTNPEKPDIFNQRSRVFYGVTGVVNFNGNDCVAEFLDPLESETVQFEGRSFPMAADFSAPLALGLAESNPRKTELENMFKPVEFESNIRLARLQPYDPKKIPILCIHGLGDSQATWAPLIQTLRGDAVIRQNYQFWFFSYPTGYPYPLVASALRKQLDAVKTQFSKHKEIVVIGHSMGGMISRTLITDSGMTLWNVVYEKPPEEMPFSPESRKVMSGALIFKHRPDVSRVIFMSPSHRGAGMAVGFFGRLGSKIIGGPSNIVDDDTELLAYARPNNSGDQPRQMPNSIDLLNPEGRFVTTMDTIPLTPGIPFHTILGDRGKGGNLSHEAPVSSDGIVPYWSSHLDGAESELIIPSDHWTNHHPQGIAEVERILHEHLKDQ